MRPARILLLIVMLFMFGDLVFRGLVPAFNFDRNDFSDPFAGAWLLRHGQDPYDSVSATRVSTEIAHANAYVVPVYPPTAYLLVAPLTLFSWKWANLIWALLGMGGVALSVYALLRITGFSANDNRSWILAALVCAFAPFHSAMHVGNAAAFVSGLCLLAIALADDRRDLRAGLTLAFAGCLKPQIALCILLFYVVRRRWALVGAATIGGLLLSAAALVAIPEPEMTWISQYQHNLHYWFRPGGLNDFSTANALRFELVNAQVVFAAVLHSPVAANVIAWTLFGLGLVVWAATMLRSARVPDSLALASVLAIGLLPVYHRTYDTAILVVALAWGLENLRGELRFPASCTLVLMLLLAMPGVGALLDPQSSIWASGLALAPAYAVLLLNIVLLFSVVRSARAHAIAPDLKVEQQLSIATPTAAA